MDRDTQRAGNTTSTGEVLEDYETPLVWGMEATSDRMEVLSERRPD